MDRWAIFIDVEGFSNIYTRSQGRGLEGLVTLVRGIFNILNAPSEKRGARLFAHQISDGFIIVSDGHEDSLNRPVAIASSLMKLMLRWGFVCRAGIGEGDFSDHSGCFDRVLREANTGGYLKVRDGVMSISQVTGTAQIKAYASQDNEFRGPLLFIDPELVPRLDVESLRFLDCGESVTCIDWLNTSGEWQRRIDEILENQVLPEAVYRKLLRGYLESIPLRSPNRENAQAMLSSTVSPRLKRKRQSTPLRVGVMLGLGFLAGLAVGLRFGRVKAQAVLVGRARGSGGRRTE